jgi:uncharacterized protein
MSAEENRKLVRGWFDSWLRGDGSPLFDHVTDDVVWTIPGTCPGAGTWHGKKEFFERSARPVAERLREPSRPASVENVYADGDAVIVEWRGTATTKSGKPYPNSYCWVMRLQAGMIREIVAYIDTALVTELFRENP